MKRMLIAAAAICAIAGAASAQPAWHPREGGPPPAYPPCSHPGQDRCLQHGDGGWHGGWGHHEGEGGWGHHWRHHHHSSTDGERG
jgi:hypothetical protein